MAKNKEIRNVAIVGTGVIGASWAALYLARGLNVVATDPAPNAEANLRKYIDAAWKTSSGRTDHSALPSSVLKYTATSAPEAVIRFWMATSAAARLAC